MKIAKKIVYPEPEEIVKYNILALKVLKVKKADKAVVLNSMRILEVVEACKNLKGDIYAKASLLLKGLIQKHPFASGNRRTAFIVAKSFLLKNGAEFGVEDNPKGANIMRGIREGYYTDKEIREWIKNGEIRKFER